MDKVEGYFESIRKANSATSIFLFAIIGIMLLILTLLLKNTFFILLLLLFIIAAMFLMGISKNQGKTKANTYTTKLTLAKEGEIFRIELTERNKIDNIYDNLKWRELIVVERIDTVKDDYYNYHDVVTTRQLQLRIWNEKEQVVLIEKLEKQPVEGIKTFNVSDLHQADFISLEPGTLQKMDALMNVSESIWE